MCIRDSLHTRIAGQETGLLQDGTVVLAGQQQGAGDAVTQGAGLAGHAAAGDGGHNVHLAGVAGGVQGLTDHHLQGVQTEILIDAPAVDGDGAGAVGEQMEMCIRDSFIISPFFTNFYIIYLFLCSILLIL